LLKGLRNMQTILSTNLKESHSSRFTELLNHQRINLSILLKITFVTQNTKLNIWSSIFLDLLLKTFYLSKPKWLNIVIAFLFSYIINNENGVSTFIIGSSYGPKSLLACSIPYLQLDNTSFDSNRPW